MKWSGNKWCNNAPHSWRQRDVNFSLFVRILVLWIATVRYYKGPVHTETFSCVFELFTVLKGIENNQLVTWNNIKMQENVSVCTGPKDRQFSVYCKQNFHSPSLYSLSFAIRNIGPFHMMLNSANKQWKYKIISICPPSGNTVSALFHILCFAVKTLIM